MALQIPTLPNRTPRSRGSAQGPGGESDADLLVSDARLAPDPQPPPDAPPELTEVALAHVAGARPGVDLPNVWQAILERRVVVCGHGPCRPAEAGRYILARVYEETAPPRPALNRLETAVLVRVLGGEQQKCVASDLDIACSTASKWYTQSLLKLRIDEAPIPLPLVIAAQAWSAGAQPPVDAVSARFEYEGAAYLLLVIPAPVIRNDTVLTQAERMVARLLIEGEPRWEIAKRRETSAQTVACQVRSIFGKHRLTGRYSLIARAMELGWFRR